MDDTERELTVNVLRCHRDQQLADMLTILIGIAAENNPDTLRACLGKVFDLSAIEETTNRTTNHVEVILDQARKIHKKVSDALYLLEQRTAKMESRVEKCEAFLERLERRLRPVTNGKHK